MKWAIHNLENGFPAVLPESVSGSSFLQDKAKLNIKLNCIMCLCHRYPIQDFKPILAKYQQLESHQCIPNQKCPKILQCPAFLNEWIDWTVKSCSYWSHCNSEHTQRKCWGGFHWLIKNHSAKCTICVCVFGCVCVCVCVCVCACVRVSKL